MKGEKRNEAFSRVHDQSLSDYATVQAPGTEISEPQEVKWEMENAQKNFALVEIQPYLIDYLKLGKPHQRALLTSENQWKTQWITP